MTLIIAGLFYPPLDKAIADLSVLSAFCCADSLGSTITDDGGLKVASTHRRKIHEIKPEVQVPNYHLGRLEGYLIRPIIPLGLAHAGTVYLTSTILIEFEATLRDLRAVRGSTDRERKLVPPWHPDATRQNVLGEDDDLSGISPRSAMRFFARLLQLHAANVIADARETFGPALHRGINDFAFVLLGYCEMERRVMAFHLDLLRQPGEPALPTVRCEELKPGEIVVLGLPSTDRAAVQAEVAQLIATTALSAVDRTGSGRCSLLTYFSPALSTPPRTPAPRAWPTGAPAALGRGRSPRSRAGGSACRRSASGRSAPNGRGQAVVC